MIDIKFVGSSDRAVVAYIRGKIPKIVAAVTDKMNFYMLKLWRKITTEYLEGKALDHRSGTLIGSVNMVPTKVEGPIITGAVQQSGASLVAKVGINYGKIWEETGSKPYDILPVNKRALANIATGWGPFAKAHHPAQAPRPFMKPALEDLRNEIVGGMKTAIVEVLQQ